MIIIGEKKKRNSIELQKNYPHLGRALNLLDSQTLRNRMMGYALVTTCYHLCPEEVREFIREKWKNEEVTKGVKKEFVEYCINKFEA
jgi:hypothetical protein